MNQIQFLHQLYLQVSPVIGYAMALVGVGVLVAGVGYGISQVAHAYSTYKYTKTNFGG